MSLLRLSAIVLFSWWTVVAQAADPENTFEWVWQTTRDGFYDPKMQGVDWDAAKVRYQSRFAAARTREAKAEIINQMLGELKTSHTRFYTPDTPDYYQLLGLFLPMNEWLGKKTASALTDGKALYTGIGIFTDVMKGQHYVRGVFESLPAHKAGLLVGDRIISVDSAPFHPIESFAGKAGKAVSIVVERSAGVKRTLSVTPALLDGGTMFADAMTASVEVIERDGKKIGYVHAWSYAGKMYQDILEDELFFGKLKDADAVVLDVRDGLGGASPSYLNIFSPRCVTFTSKSRTGETVSVPSCWPKPVVLLVNGGSRSGKELVAYTFKRGHFGPIVGTRTAGAVVAGKILANDNDASLLYLAANDVTVDNGVRLEGVGVEPDIEVPFEIPFAQGRDPQKERAVLEAAKRAVAGRS